MFTLKSTSILAALVLLGTVVFFDISFDPVLSLPHEARHPDEAQEQRYAACMEDRDADIHQRAFDTIDNPDVQREFISAHREQAEIECRKRFPKRTITVREALRFNLIDIEPRFGRKLTYQ